MCKPFKRRGAKLNERSRTNDRRRMIALGQDLRAEGLDKFDRGIR